ncbi:MAG: MOSC domain-containing protein [Gaiellales bacterium]
MPVTVRAIHLSPIKSLRLVSVERAQLDESGIPDDRRFLLLDERGRVATQRNIGALATAEAGFDAEAGTLSLRMPDGRVITDTPRPDGHATTILWGRRVDGRFVQGPWSEALSELAGRTLRLVQADRTPLRGLDDSPVSLLSIESVAELARRNGLEASPDHRRFRPTLLLEGGRPHIEDEWVGSRLRIGGAIVHVRRRDPRCALTRRNPDSGALDLDTLGMIAAYRPPGEEGVYFGVYGDVVRAGAVSVGDPVEPLPEDAA